MQLTRFSDFALRVLLYAHAAGDRLVTIEEIAGAYRISRTHLTKVANALTRGGYLTAVRGRAGGLRLARPPGQIRLGDIVRLTEPDFALVECLSSDGKACAIDGCCRLPAIMRRALRAFLAELDRHTLADIALRQKDVRHVFAELMQR